MASQKIQLKDINTSQRESLIESHSNLLQVPQISSDFISEEENSELSSGDEGIGGRIFRRPKVVNLRQRSGCSLFCFHLGLLLHKNCLLFRRNIKPTLFILVNPIFFVLLMIYLQYILGQYADVQVIHPETQYPGISHCMGKNCVTLGYGVIGKHNQETQWIDQVMTDVAINSNLQFGKDVQFLVDGKSEEIDLYFQTHKNKTAYAVVFCLTKFQFNSLEIPCTYDDQDGWVEPTQGPPPKRMLLYYLMYNFTLEPNTYFLGPEFPSHKDPALLQIKQSVDQAIGRIVASGRNTIFADVDIDYSRFPMAKDRFLGNADIVATVGGFYYILSPLVIFVIILIEMAREKQLRLRQGLQVVGLQSCAYWCHWGITSFILSAICCLIMILSSMIAGFQFFFNAPFLLIFLFFMEFAFAMVSISFCITTCVTSQRLAYALSYAIVLLAIVMEMAFCNVLAMYYIFFLDGCANWILFFRYLFEFCPPFLFAKIYGHMTRISSRHFDDVKLTWAEGVHFQWSFLLDPIHASFVTGDSYSLYAPIWDHVHLIVNGVFFLLLASYFDHVLSSNRGSSETVCYFLTGRYWASCCGCCEKRGSREHRLEKRRRKISFNPRSNLNEAALPWADLQRRDTAREEVQKVKELEEEGVPAKGLRVIGIKKTFYKWPFGIVSAQDVKANKGIYFDAAEAELLCILGHNGAGKSTLINILTGVLGPTAGSAKIAGCDIIEDMEQIRLKMGVVPQFDILWDDLTAAEHIRLYARLKSIPESEIPSLITERLKDVSLLDCGDALVKSFSGGMKRRLSVTIGAIGNPSILFMDEPTTGMDPVSRRQVWSLIQRLKKNRTVILTTHSMEEADVLADRVAVIVDGLLKCIGTSLYLKNTYGDGYRISIVCDSKDAEEVERLVLELVPSSHLTEQNAGSMIFAVPIVSVSDVAPFFELMESSSIRHPSSEEIKINDEPAWELSARQKDIVSHLLKLVKDCGISHTTLEEVFMIVTGKKGKKTAGEDIEMKDMGELADDEEESDKE